MTKDRYGREKTWVIRCDPNTEEGRSRTRQEFEKDANMNTIMRKYRQTGLLVEPGIGMGRKAIYGDFSEGVEFREVQNRIVQANQNFMLLPPDVRAKFGNDVSNLIDFLSDEANLEEAVELGLVDPKVIRDKDAARKAAIEAQEKAAKEAQEQAAKEAAAKPAEGQATS